jgi:hypothetical protein
MRADDRSNDHGEGKGDENAGAGNQRSPFEEPRSQVWRGSVARALWILVQVWLKRHRVPARHARATHHRGWRRWPRVLPFSEFAKYCGGGWACGARRLHRRRDGPRARGHHRRAARVPRDAREACTAAGALAVKRRPERRVLDSVFLRGQPRRVVYTHETHSSLVCDKKTFFARARGPSHRLFVVLRVRPCRARGRVCVQTPTW